MSRTVQPTHSVRLRAALAALACGSAAAAALLAAPAASFGSVPQCRTTQLHASYVGSDGAAGSEGIEVALTNVSATTCTMQYFPGVGLLNSHGALIGSVNVVRVSGFPEPLVTVAPGKKAYFTFLYESGGPCIPHTFNAYGIQIIPPNQRAALKLHFGTFNVCDVSVGGHPKVYPIRKSAQL
jgi:hypothetical protein